MDYMLLIVAIIITLIMGGFYVMWLRTLAYRLGAIFGWIFFIGGFFGLAATSYGFIDASRDLWLIPLFIGGLLSVAVHILNNRMVARLMREADRLGTEE